MKHPFDKTAQEKMTHDAILRALVENYESIYAVNMETSAYQCFHESDSFSSLCIENCGDDFFEDFKHNIDVIHPEDREYVLEMLSKDVLLAGLTEEKYHTFVYRLVIGGVPLYHKLRATKDEVGGRPCILIGVRNIDKAYRQDKAHADALSALQSKEKNHLAAILASAEGYLEINLTKNSVTELSPPFLSDGAPMGLSAALKSVSSYSAFEEAVLDHFVVENRKKYKEISDRNYLIRCFEGGEKRASVSFSVKMADGRIQPCKKVFYLYRDDSSQDILSFCVIYDLTEQQQKEKELRDLERELQLSRLRNFTGQMQPHFLYNALGSIQEIVLDDPVYASKLIGDFTVHLRSCIRAMSHDVPIPFEQELANIQAYVNIEKMRFGDKLKVVFDLPVQNFCILPLSVQPIVENAIRHGIYQRGDAGGTVTVKTAEKETMWQVIVEDDGVGFDAEAFFAKLAEGSSDSTGLKNIRFRLDKVMHAQVGITSRVGVGTSVTISIPKEVKT